MKTNKRKYDSTRRKKQARETRRQIVAASRDLFIQNGYAATTMEAIAQKSEVAVETIYAAFRSKRNLLIQAVNISVVGDDDPLSLFERPQIKAVEMEPDPRLKIQMFSRQITDIMARIAPLFQVMRNVAKTDPAISDILADVLQGRFEGMEHFISLLIQTGQIDRDSDTQLIAETVWALSSAEVYSLLTQDRGWSNEKYQDWLAETLRKLLIP